MTPTVDTKRTKQGRPTIGESPWKTTTEAAEALDVCRDHLLRLRRSGQLRKGFHWRAKNPTSARLTYQFHVKRMEQWLAEVVEV
jgi:hypothetical protein